MLRPGFEWDATVRPGRWKPVDYSKLTDEELAQRRRDASDRQAEYAAQVQAFLPVAAAQAIINKGVLDLQALILKLAREAPDTLAKLL